MATREEVDWLVNISEALRITNGMELIFRVPPEFVLLKIDMSGVIGRSISSGVRLFYFARLDVIYGTGLVLVISKMDIIQGLKQTKVCQILLAITFLGSGLVLNIIQGVLYYGLRPFSKYFFRKINYYINYSLYCQLVFLAQHWANTRLTLHVNKSEYEKYYGKEHGYLIMNHTYEIDWIVGWILCDNVGLLGNCKSYAKRSIQYLPTIGWAWKFSESIFLDRNWEKDKYVIKNQITELIQYPDPMWLLLTAEGTRFTEAKYQLSKSFAEKNGLPVLKHHLTPRTKGFTTSLPHLRKNVNAIYNVILAFNRDGVQPTLKSLLLGKTIEANMYVQRIPISEVPEDEEEAAKWLHELFKKKNHFDGLKLTTEESKSELGFYFDANPTEFYVKGIREPVRRWNKDEMFDSFLETGSWFAKSGAERVNGFVLRRRIHSLLNTLGWAIVTLSGISYFMFKLVLTGSIIYLIAASCVIAFFAFFFQNLVGQTQISRGSSYGAK